MKARYIRVSTEKQKLDRQEELQTTTEKLYIDVVSGAIDFNKREGGQELLKDIDQGIIDYLSVSSIDRLGRNLFDILKVLERLNEKKVNLKVDNLGIESLVRGKPNSAFKLIVSVLANIAEMERETMLERQKQGIAIAKAKGVYKGRVKGSKESDDEVLAKYKNVVKQLKKGQSLRNTAKICGVSLGTVQKVKSIVDK